MAHQGEAMPGISIPDSVQVMRVEKLRKVHTSLDSRIVLLMKRASPKTATESFGLDRKMMATRVKRERRKG